MRIDNRLLLPFVLPFVVLALIRLMWWVAGAAWTTPEVAAIVSIAFGIIIGIGIAFCLFIEDETIGFITLYPRTKEVSWDIVAVMESHRKKEEAAKKLAQVVRGFLGTGRDFPVIREALKDWDEANEHL